MYLPTFLALFWPSPPSPPQRPLDQPKSQAIEVKLRHVHAHSGGRVVFKDVNENHLQAFGAVAETSYSFTPISQKTHRPRSQSDFFRARDVSKGRIRKGSHGDEDDAVVIWDEWDVPGPNHGSRDTLTALAKMTWNAYMTPDDGTWYDLGDAWPNSYPFGWEPDEDGFRGHIFATDDNSTVIASIKGTSAGVFGGGGPTVRKDKLNDNLLFSCCCARVDWSWTTVCGCYGGGWKCDNDCVQESLVEESLFYPLGTNLYNNLTYMFPDATIWLTGHSLGGALAGLLGVTFGAPVVTFETPGARMASRRLHLPQPPSVQHVTHVFHTADPIPMGACTGVLSSCAIAGYAMESRCHLGRKRVYDTVTRYGWSVDVRTHRIGVVIDRLLAEDWDEPGEDGSPGREVPELTWDDEECDREECYSWEYGNFKNSSSSLLSRTLDDLHSC